MSTNTHLTRIEREAKEYAEKTWEGFRPNIETSAHKVQSRIDYKIGANREKDRAAPVVGALDGAIAVIETECDDQELVAELKQILETYKNDNV